jgi:hypothetical protein
MGGTQRQSGHGGKEKKSSFSRIEQKTDKSKRKVIFVCGHYHCNTVCNVAAGHHVANLTPSTTNGNCTSDSHNKRRSRPAASLRRTLDDLSSEDEGTASKWHQTSPESDTTSTDDVLPVSHQDIDADVDDSWTLSRQKSKSAAEEYQSVMTMLRNKQQANKVSPLSSCPFSMFWVL